MTRTTDAHKIDLLAADHFPVCPKCNNLCGLLAQVCADCGHRLYPSDVDLAAAASVGLSAMRRRRIAAQVREDAKATRERGA